MEKNEQKEYISSKILLMKQELHLNEIVVVFFISLSVEGGGDEGGNKSSPPPLKKSASARNVAKLLKKTISKHNLLAAAESLEAQTPNQNTLPSAQAAPDHTHTNGDTDAAGPERENCSTDPDHQAEMSNQKHMRKKDSCSLATVTEETNGDGDER